MNEPVQPYMPGFEGEQRRADKSQWYTPPALAARMWAWMDLVTDKPMRVLEPSAGRGALILPLRALPVHQVIEVVAYDVDPTNVEHLAGLGPALLFDLTVRQRDFLADADLLSERFDVACMNPPFEDNQDVRFIERVCDVTTRVAAICQSRIVHSAGRAEFWRWHDIVREAILIERPQFGGDFSPMTDFVVLDITRRKHARKQGEASAASVEWWGPA